MEKEAPANQLSQVEPLRNDPRQICEDARHLKLYLEALEEDLDDVLQELVALIKDSAPNSPLLSTEDSGQPLTQTEESISGLICTLWMAKQTVRDQARQMVASVAKFDTLALTLEQEGSNPDTSSDENKVSGYECIADNDYEGTETGYARDT